MSWDSELSAIRPELEQFFEHLHQHPEVSWQEFETTKFLAGHLERLGVQVRTFPNRPGVIAEWGPESGPVVAIRSDIDALWQVVDGEWKANHSCGHDAHMTVVFGVVALLRKAFDNPPIRIRALFQPAEEKGEGAIFFCEQGALEAVAMLFGLHLRPVQEIPTGIFAPAILNGAAVHLSGKIHGTAAHGARPHLGVNAIEVAFSILQTIQAMHVNPVVPHSIKMTRITAGGESHNIIPDYAEFSFDIRAQTNQVLGEIVEEAKRRIQGVSTLYGAKVDIGESSRTVAAKGGGLARSILSEAIVACRGDESLSSDIVTPGAEDFHYYSVLNPGLEATMLGVGCNLAPGLHHPNMTFERHAMFDAMVILADAVHRAIQHFESVR